MESSPISILTVLNLPESDNFNMTTFGHVILDENCKFDLKSADKLRQVLKAKMLPFAACKEIKQSVFENDDQLLSNQDIERDRFTFSYAGVSIQLALKVGVKAAQAVAKVICTHEYEVLGEAKSENIGEFSIDERGMTNFIEQSGKPYYVSEAADLIVAYFLKKALDRNFDI